MWDGVGCEGVISTGFFARTKLPMSLRFCLVMTCETQSGNIYIYGGDPEG